jgi:hypothetical protein
METLRGFPCLPVLVRGQPSWPTPHTTSRAHLMRMDNQASSSDESDTRSRHAWNWLYFIFGFVPVVILFLAKPWTSFREDYGAHVVELAAASTVAGVVAGTYGEGAVRRIIRAIRRR